MKLTVNQVAEKLKISNAVVKNLINKGQLTDLKKRDETKKKHFSLVDSAELNEFAKTYNKRVKIQMDHEVPAPLSAKDGIQTRLINIERKLDKLISIWS